MALIAPIKGHLSRKTSSQKFHQEIRYDCLFVRILPLLFLVPRLRSRTSVRSDYTLKIRYGEIVTKKSLQFFILCILN
jgi:hypothetical protein